MKRELSEDMVNLIREQKADALMTQPTPPPRCRVPKCGKTVHLRRDGWYHDDGTYFCRSSAISRNSDDHAMPERRLSDPQLLHRLWTKAVGTKDYVKAEWQSLENRLFRYAMNNADDRRKLERRVSGERRKVDTVASLRPSEQMRRNNLDRRKAGKL